MRAPPRRGVLAAAVAVLFAGCGGVANLNIPTPPVQPTDAGATTTVVSDLTGVSLTPVVSAPPVTVVLTPGKASLSGIVTGPSGVVPGATVLIERLVNESVGAKTVLTQADGTWKLAGILGGRYRIRAWRAPDLALTTPQVTLLGASDNPNVNLILLSYNGQSVTATVVPSPPAVGQAATLLVQASQQAVGADGIVRAAPLAGAAVQVYAAGNVVLAGTNPGTTDSSGRMQLMLGCSSIGPVGLSATVNNLTSFPVAVPDCGAYVSPFTPPSTAFTPPTLSVP